jgi:adenylate cyclase
LSLQRFTRRFPVIVPAGLFVTAAMLVAYVVQPSLLTRLDLKVYDLLLPLRASPQASALPVIIDLDEASLKAYGQWPWPRYLMADLLNALTKDYGAAAIAVDIIFAEADRSSPGRMREALRRDKGFAPAFSDIPEDFHDFDRILARSIRNSPVVVGAYADYSGAKTETPPPSATIVERELPGAIPWRPRLPVAAGALMPIPELRGEAPLGFINAAPDMDGIIRKIPLVVRVGDEVHPNLSLRALMRAFGQKRLTLVSGPYGIESVRFRAGEGNLSIPVDPQGMLNIPFIGPRGTYAYFSAADILRRRVDPKALQGRLTLVGTSIIGLSDFRATPLDPSCPGVEIHAAALDTMLAGNAIEVPPWSPLAQLFGILITGIASTVAFGFARPRVSLPAGVSLVSAAVLVSRNLFARGVFVSPLYFVLTAFFVGALLVLIRFGQEELQKRRVRAIFSRYVAPEVVKRLTSGEASEDLFAGEEKTLSILFSDIRGFTSLSETLRPREVVNLLNRYFTVMTGLVRDSSGTLDKFIGDALMAYWNAPLDVPDHALKAVRAALGMQTALSALNIELKAELDLEIHIGVGVHTGSVFVGNMGSKDLVNYTLIGDNVNLASRLEGLCPQYGVGVLVSEEARRGCGDAFGFLRLDTLRVKGKQQAVSVYQPLRHDEIEARREEIVAWEDAFARYTAGDFAEAQTRLAALYDTFPENKLYAIFYDRVIHLQMDPPPYWNGVWIWTSK